MVNGNQRESQLLGGGDEAAAGVKYCSAVIMKTNTARGLIALFVGWLQKPVLAAVVLYLGRQPIVAKTLSSVTVSKTNQELFFTIYLLTTK